MPIYKSCNLQAHTCTDVLMQACLYMYSVVMYHAYLGICHVMYGTLSIHVQLPIHVSHNALYNRLFCFVFGILQLDAEYNQTNSRS